MASEMIRRVRIFRIGKGEDGWAVYTQRRAQNVKSADEAEELIRAVEAGQERLEALVAPSNRARPERNLDIDEPRANGGTCRYSFLLDPEQNGDQRLLFASRDPFIALPLNSSSGERFLDIPDRHVSRVRAYFDCNLDDVRGSPLAERLRYFHEDEHGDPKLNIPFTFNVVDPIIKAAPWVVPGHSPGRALSKDRHPDDPHSHRHADDRTHGGVHPSSSAFLSVDL